MQRALIAGSFCKGDRQLVDAVQPTRFNMLANAALGRQVRDSATPDLRELGVPVLLLLGECSYVPRGRAMEYFDVYRIARSHLIPGVGHITRGNAAGARLTRQAIVRFLDGQPGPLPDEPTQASREAFVAAGR